MAEQTDEADLKSAHVNSKSFINKDLRNSGAPYGARLPTNCDLDLQAVVDAWSSLPDIVKAGIMAMVKAASAEAADA